MTGNQPYRNGHLYHISIPYTMLGLHGKRALGSCSKPPLSKSARYALGHGLLSVYGYARVFILKRFEIDSMKYFSYKAGKKRLKK